MERNSNAGSWLTMLLLALFFYVMPTKATPCTDLTKLSLPNTSITSATDLIPPFDTTFRNRPQQETITGSFPLCRVLATMTPTSDSTILFEMWLPAAANWNGNFVAVGNGGTTGYIWRQSMERPMQMGYAVASNDLGHEDSRNGVDFAVGHPEKFIDYSYRADHLTSQLGKALIKAYYAKAPKQSYFKGCSNGGHQALMEAQRFPDDYSGIIVGAPWNQWLHQDIGFLWGYLQLEHFDKSKLPMVHKAVMTACPNPTALSGDGYLDDPRECRFDASVLQCKDEAGSDCLTPHEVQTIDALYRGPVNPRTDQILYPGYEIGTEGRWTGNVGFFGDIFRYVLFENPAWDPHVFNFDSDVSLIDQKLAVTVNSVNPNLSEFKAHGGKMILWHGWSDSTISPENSVNYYNSVVAITGGGLDVATMDDARLKKVKEQIDQDLGKTQGFFRLFMAPGVEHCDLANSPGPGRIGGADDPPGTGAGTAPADPDHDLLSALNQWVDKGVAPDKIVASHFTKDNVLDKTRPLCAYPKVAQYKGTGDVNDAANFECVDDKAAFKADINREINNIRVDLKLKTWDNLPN